VFLSSIFAREWREEDKICGVLICAANFQSMFQLDSFSTRNFISWLSINRF